MDALPGEWQSLKTLVSYTFKDKSYSSLWHTVSTKEPYRTDYKVIYTSALKWKVVL